jgi:hypothetical protein
MRSQEWERGTLREAAEKNGAGVGTIADAAS